MEFEKFSMLGVKIHKANLQDVCMKLTNTDFDKSEYVLFPDLSVISQAAINPKLNAILQQAYLVLPDGKPSEVVARFKGFDKVKTVSGYDLFLKILKETELTHFFYGSTNEKLKKIEKNLKKMQPLDNKVLGYKSAPFLEIDNIKGSKRIEEDLRMINDLQPDFIWVGLSSPKQDYLLYHHHEVLDNGIMLGVGGVFDYLSKDVKISPEWVKNIGMRWLYRLFNEPIRLFPKYQKILLNIIQYRFFK